MPYFLILHFYFATFRCAIFAHILFTNHRHNNHPFTPAKSRKYSKNLEVTIFYRIFAADKLKDNKYGYYYWKNKNND